MRYELGPWTPDAAKMGRGRMRDVRNVTPRADHYAPFYNLSPVGDAIDARGRGLVAYRDIANGVHQYAGDATKLYARQSDGSWDNASKAGGYTATDSTRWRGTQFGDFCIMTNGQDPIQAIEMSSGTDFADLSGSPPVAQFVCTFGDFVVLANLDSSPFGYKWSSLGNCFGWTDGVDQASSGAFADGGAITGLAANQTSLFFFQQSMVRRGLYVGGPLIIDIQPIEQQRGCAASGSIAALGQWIFFLAEDGFYQLTDAGAAPIGDGVVNAWFLADADRDYYYRMTSAIDPFRQLYVVSYASTSAASGAPDTLLLYHWPSRRWSYVRVSVEVLAPIISLSTTMEDLDALFSSLDDLTISLDDPLFAGGALSLAGIGADRRLGVFSGDALEAVFETDELLAALGATQFISGVMPFGDPAACYAQIGKRLNPAAALSWSTEQPMHARTGICPARVETRFARARLRIPAATVWTKMEAMELTIQPAEGEQ